MWGDASRSDASVAHSLGDIGLPVTMRLSLAGESEGTDTRRQTLLIAAFVLLASGVAIAAYAVFRSVNRKVG